MHVTGADAALAGRSVSGKADDLANLGRRADDLPCRRALGEGDPRPAGYGAQ